MNRHIRNRSVLIEALEGRRMLAGEFHSVIQMGSDRKGDFANEIVLDAAGNQYIVGTFKLTADFDPRRDFEVNRTARGDGTDLFVAKYSPERRLLWVRTFGSASFNDSAERVVIGPTGDVYVAGEFHSLIDFGTKGAPMVVDGNGKRDVFFMRMDGDDGDVQWVRSYGGSEDDSVSAIAVGPTGDLFYAGTIRLKGDINPGPAVSNYETTGVDDVVIGRLRGVDGLPLADPVVFGEDDTREEVVGMHVDGRNRPTVIGSFIRRVRFDRGNSKLNRSSKGSDDVYIARLSPRLEWDFITTFGGSKKETVIDTAVGPDGDLYVTGNFVETADFDPSEKKFSIRAEGTSDAYMARYSPTGVFRWAGNIGGDESRVVATAIAVDGRGNIFASGVFEDEDEVDLNPGPGVFEVEVDKDNDAGVVVRGLGIGRTDAYIVKLNAAGRFLYGRTIGGEDGSVLTSALATDAAGNIYATGGFTQRVDFDPSPKTEFIRRTTDAERDSDVFILRLLA